MKVGFVGVGQIGAPMAGHLLRAGHDLTVLDTRQEAMAPLVQLGARAAAMPAELSETCRRCLVASPACLPFVMWLPGQTAC